MNEIVNLARVLKPETFPTLPQADVADRMRDLLIAAADLIEATDATEHPLAVKAAQWCASLLDMIEAHTEDLEDDGDVFEHTVGLDRFNEDEFYLDGAEQLSKLAARKAYGEASSFIIGGRRHHGTDGDYVCRVNNAPGPIDPHAPMFTIGQATDLFSTQQARAARAIR